MWSPEYRRARGDWCHDYAATPEWRDRVARYWATHERACQACLRGQGDGAVLVVHHASSEAYDTAFRRPGSESDEMLRGLCWECHARLHDLTFSRGGNMSLAAATREVLDNTERWVEPVPVLEPVRVSTYEPPTVSYEPRPMYPPPAPPPHSVERWWHAPPQSPAPVRRRMSRRRRLLVQAAAAVTLIVLYALLMIRFAPGN